MIPLNQIHVAAPCRQSWDEMDGDEQKRFCQSCRQNVYNISEMSRAEAEKLIREKEGRLCVRFYRRTDGTVMTKDCPVGLRALRLRAAAVFSGLVTMILGGVGIAKHGNAAQQATMGGPLITAPPAMMGTPAVSVPAKHSSIVSRVVMGKPVMPRHVSNTTPKNPSAMAPHQEVMGDIAAPIAHKSTVQPPKVIGHIRPVILGHGKHTHHKNGRKTSPK